MIKKIIDELKYWSQLFLVPIYWFSFITPRNKKIWILGSNFGKSFTGNPRYFYLYLSQFKKDNIRPIWISKDKNIVKFLKENNLEAYYYNSLNGIYYCLVGGVYLFDNYSKDISFWLSGGAIKINLWHGTGNKKTNYDNKFDKIRHPKNKWEKFRNALRRMSDEKPNHYVVATSKMMAPIFSSAFQTPINRIIVNGYPRNDILFSNCKLKVIYTNKEKRVIKYLKKCKENGKTIIIYMPTFRQSEVKFFDYMNLKVFNDFLNRKNMMFFTKLHPKSKLKDKFNKIKYSNIKNIDTNVDSYTILGFADILATDYSSIHTDFTMLNRPSVLFTYDLDDYSNDTRECYFDYDEYMPEVRTYTMKEFMKALDDVLKHDTRMEGRLKLRDKMFDDVDCYSSDRLYKKIINVIDMEV